MIPGTGERRDDKKNIPEQGGNNRCRDRAGRGPRTPKSEENLGAEEECQGARQRWT